MLRRHRFTVPVFGKGVVYDVSGDTLIEQKKFVKAGLNIPRFKGYVDLMVEEVEKYFEKEWGDSGTKELLMALNQVTVFTSTRCLQGQEVRDKFTMQFADLYNDLDAALSPIGFFYPNLPLPSMRRRDNARKELNGLFSKIMKQRLENPQVEHEDMLATFMSSQYKDGKTLTDDEIVGLLIALLLAGQHTSNVTATWMGIFLMTNPQEMEKALKEQEEIMGGKSRLTYDDLDRMESLHYVLRETLRLRPPIVILMRRVLQDVAFKDYIIPKDSLVAASPALNHNLPEFWTNPEKFDPDRFSPKRNEHKTNSYCYMPFGIGRHQCIGEQFAYLQIKAVWSTLLRKYKFELIGDTPQPNYTTLIAGPVPPVMVRYEKRH